MIWVESEGCKRANDSRSIDPPDLSPSSFPFFTSDTGVWIRLVALEVQVDCNAAATTPLLQSTPLCSVGYRPTHPTPLPLIPDLISSLVAQPGIVSAHVRMMTKRQPTGGFTIVISFLCLTTRVGVRVYENYSFIVCPGSICNSNELNESSKLPQTFSPDAAGAGSRANALQLMRGSRANLKLGVASRYMNSPTRMTWPLLAGAFWAQQIPVLTQGSLGQTTNKVSILV